MAGRIEKEKKAKEKMEKKLETLPPIFSLFYNWMNARDKTYIGNKACADALDSVCSGSAAG